MIRLTSFVRAKSSTFGVVGHTNSYVCGRFLGIAYFAVATTTALTNV